MMTNHHHHLVMGAIVLVVEDHIGIQGNHRIHHRIRIPIGVVVVDGISRILHLHTQIPCMGALRIMGLHQIIHILPHLLVTVDVMITIYLCMAAIPRLIDHTIIEVPHRHYLGLIIQVCRYTHLI